MQHMEGRGKHRKGMRSQLWVVVSDESSFGNKKIVGFSDGCGLLSGHANAELPLPGLVCYNVRNIFSASRTGKSQSRRLPEYERGKW